MIRSCSYTFGIIASSVSRLPLRNAARKSSEAVPSIGSMRQHGARFGGRQHAASTRRYSQCLTKHTPAVIRALGVLRAGIAVEQATGGTTVPLMPRTRPDATFALKLAIA